MIPEHCSHPCPHSRCLPKADAGDKRCQSLTLSPATNPSGYTCSKVLSGKEIARSLQWREWVLMRALQWAVPQPPLCAVLGSTS